MSNLADNHLMAFGGVSGADRIGQLLLARGKLDAVALERILSRQRERAQLFGDAALELGVVTAADIDAALCEQFGCPRVQGGQLDPALVTLLKPYSEHAEALRALRSDLLLRWFDDPERRALAIAGVDVGRAQAELAANLAVSFAQAGVRTLLIDCDLRAPLVDTLLGMPGGPGLADMIAGRCDPETRTIPGLESLAVLPAGARPPNPQELLASPRYAQLLESFSGQFEAIVLTTTRLGTVADAQLVARQVGGVLLVAREHRTRLLELAQAQRKLALAGAAVLGVALTA